MPDNTQRLPYGGIHAAAIADLAAVLAGTAGRLAPAEHVRTAILQLAHPRGRAVGYRAVTDNTTLLLDDAGKVVSVDAASAKSVTIPTHANAAIPYDPEPSQITIVRAGAGALTIQADAGVTLNGVVGGAVACRVAWQGVQLFKIGQNSWIAPDAFVGMLRYVGHATAASASVTIPASADRGDFCLCINRAVNVSSTVPTSIVPDDFDPIINTGASAGSPVRAIRGIVSAKILTVDDPGTPVTGMNEDGEQITVLVLRPNFPLSGWTAHDLAGEISAGAPAVQTISVDGVGPLPLLSFAQRYCTDSDASFSAQSKMREVGPDAAGRHRFRIDNSGETPTDIVVSTNDGGTNLLQSGYLKLF